MTQRLRGLLALFVLAGCQATPPAHGGFADDLSLLRRHVPTIVLTSPTGARIAVAPTLGGAVLTSTTGGEAAPSFGWIDRAGLATADASTDARGGEDRLELGPVGGRCGLAPVAAATDGFAVVEHGAARVVCAGTLTRQAAHGTRFTLGVRREVQLRDPDDVLAALGVAPEAGVHVVSFETITTVTNADESAWTKDGGLPALRIVGTFPAATGARVLLPFVGGPERYHGDVVLGDAAHGRATTAARIDPERSLLVAATLATNAGGPPELAIGPRRAKPVFGCWDATRGVLTLIEFTLPLAARDYVDWHGERPDEPFGGGVVATQPASAADGGYRLASHAPALALDPGGKAVHVHRTTHLTGPREALADIARRVLGADLGTVPHGAR